MMIAPGMPGPQTARSPAEVNAKQRLATAFGAQNCLTVQQQITDYQFSYAVVISCARCEGRKVIAQRCIGCHRSGAAYDNKQVNDQ